MVSSLLCLPVSCCLGEQETAPLDKWQRSDNSLNAVWWAGAGLWVTGRSLELSILRNSPTGHVYFTDLPFIFSVRLSGALIFISFCGTFLIWAEIFFFLFFFCTLLLSLPHSLHPSWQPPLPTASVMTLCIFHSEVFREANTNFWQSDFCLFCEVCTKKESICMAWYHQRATRKKCWMQTVSENPWAFSEIIKRLSWTIKGSLQLLE